MDIVEEFRNGVDAYWSGDVPEGWEAVGANDNPFLAGWNISAQQDNAIGFFADAEDWSDDDDDWPGERIDGILSNN